MLNKIANIAKKTVVDSVKNYCGSVTKYYSKTQPKLMELGTTAVSSAIENIKDLITHKSEIEKIKEEAAKQAEIQKKKSQKNATILGACALAAGGIAGFALAKKNTIKKSDYVFEDKNVVPQQKFEIKPKQFTESKGKYKLSSDGTTLLQKL